MRAKLEVALEWLEKVADIILTIVPATRTVVSLLESEKAE